MTNANNVQPMNNTDGKMATGDALTDIGVYASTADKNIAGKLRQRNLAMRVSCVSSDRATFTIASGNDEIYVMLDDASARGVGTH